MIGIGKSVRFLRLLMTEPVEFLDRVQVYSLAVSQKLVHRGLLEPYSDTLALPDCLRRLCNVLHHDLFEILAENEFKNIESYVYRWTQSMAGESLPFPIIYNADPALAQCAYALTRILQP